jgi:hypothetical protein
MRATPTGQQDRNRSARGTAHHVHPCTLPAVDAARKVKPTPNRRRHDWDAMRTLYVQGIDNGDGTVTWPTLADVAARHDVQPALVRAHSGRKGWVDARAERQAELAKELREARAREFVERSAKIDATSVSTAELAMRLVQGRVQELALLQENRLQALAASSTYTPPADDLPIELTRLGLAAVRFHQLAMRATGQEAERAGAGGVAPGDPTDGSVSAAERRLAEQVARQVQEALVVPSTDMSQASVAELAARASA